MPISISRYVNITSAVAGQASVSRRDLIARLFTTNELIPTETVVEFTSLDDVGTRFPTTSEEYRRAAFYFGFISKNITRPRRISFARWANVDTAPQVFGSSHDNLAQLQTITGGQINISFGGVLLALTGIDFSGASSLADVATIMQTAVQTGTGTVFTAATVTYNATAGRFELEGGATGNSIVEITAGTTGDVAESLGWLSGAIVSNGVIAQSVTQVLSQTTELSNNFGSFRFINTLTDDQVVEAATWNEGQAPNVVFQFHHGTLPADAAALSAALNGIGGVGVTLLSADLDQYPEMLPMAILAATDYSLPGAAQNYMYQRDDRLTATVTTNADANLYDGLGINYYGNTQQAGQIISFYQRGFLFGSGNDIRDMGAYANEQWLKDSIGVDFLNLQLASSISANEEGRVSALGVIQETIDLALVNGSILAGGTLTNLQRASVSEISGDPLAFQQVETSGYWVTVRFQDRVVNGVTESVLVYTLIYNDDDVVRSIEGTHALI